MCILGREDAQRGEPGVFRASAYWGGLTMKAGVHLMVDYDRQPMCIFASHFAKGIAHGQSEKKQLQETVLCSVRDKR